MTTMPLEGHLGTLVPIDVCTACQAFWFDKFESLQLVAGSTLTLMRLIGEHSSSARPSNLKAPRCPRCSTRLLATQDLQGNTRFKYSRCNAHGRFIGFFDFLKEKNFIRSLSPRQIEDLRRTIQIVNCSNCGAPIDLTTNSACAHCASPISMLDMDQPQQMLAQLRQAASRLEPARSAPAGETSFMRLEADQDWWQDASSSNLVQAGLNAVVRWLGKAGL
jgi:DNA-directed RNA polymerase subunit RPC12/RpoP